MASTTLNWLKSTLHRIYGWRRLRVVLITAAIIFLLLAYGWTISYWILIGRWIFFGLCALTVFGLFERWPQRLPKWMARWALQVGLRFSLAALRCRVLGLR